MQLKHFGSRFGSILMIQTVHIVESVVKISTVKNDVDRIQFNSPSILFYNLINKYNT